MEIEKSQVTKLLITGGDRLDPITVFIEDLGSRTIKREDKPDHITRQGKITIECYGESWSSYWGGMGPRTVAQFFCDCGDDYLMGCLARGMSSTQFSGEALKDLAKSTIIKRRRRTDVLLELLDKEDARQFFDRVEDTSAPESRNELFLDPWEEILSDVFGDEWWYSVDDKAVEPSHKYTYLTRIIETVQAGLRQADMGVAA